MKLNNINKHKKNAFTLIETLLVLGLASLIAIGVITQLSKRAEERSAENAGKRLAEVGQALNLYTQNNRAELLSYIPAGSTVLTDICILRGSCAGVTLPPGVVVAPFPTENLLPRSFANDSLLDTGYIVSLKNFNNERIVGTITTDAAVTLGASDPRYDLLGVAARAAGNAAGMSYRSGTVISGLNGGWELTRGNSATNPDVLMWGAAPVAGVLAYRTGFDGDYDDMYVRRDGLYEMTGDLQMGNNNIRDVNSITFDNYIAGQNAFFQNLRTQAIYNAGEIYTDTLSANRGFFGRLDTNNINPQDASIPGQSQDVVFGASGDINDPANADNARIDAAGKMYVQDIFIGGGNGADRVAAGSARSVYGWLSDRLPRYSSRGAYLVNTQGNADVVTKPTNCGNGIPKIEVIPQAMWTQGRVLGDIRFNYQNNGNWEVQPDLYSVGPTLAYAIDLENETPSIPAWQVIVSTQDYSNPLNPDDSKPIRNGVALVHVYCDFGTIDRASASLTN